MPETARTDRPPFDVEHYARESEARIEAAKAPDSRRDTSPPPSVHGRLRDSCKDLAVAQRDGESGVTALTSTPALGAVAVPLVSDEDIGWYDLGDSGRAVLEHVDDRLIVEEILAVTHVPIPEGIAVFQRLAQLGLVAFRAP